jgi:hypothetical protein
MGSHMIYARLQVGEPVADKAPPPLVGGNRNASSPYSAPFRINGRLSVLDDSISRHAFDTVQLSLRGMRITHRLFQRGKLILPHPQVSSHPASGTKLSSRT